MARTDALLRLHANLVSRRDELRRRLGKEYLRDLDSRAGDSGDSADMAFENGSDEVNSQLAQLESRELAQIDLAIRKLKTGMYGRCEGCQKKIPVARLNALPFTPTCIACQREMETYGHLDGRDRGDWGKVADGFEDKEIRIADLEMDLSR